MKGMTSVEQRRITFGSSPGNIDNTLPNIVVDSTISKHNET